MPEGRHGLLGPAEFRRRRDLEHLLAGAEPIATIDELVIDDVSEAERAAFLEAIGS